MKTVIFLALGAAIAMGQSAPNKAPIDRKALAEMEEIQAFCAGVDADSTEMFKDLIKQFSAGQSVTDLAEARKSKEYLDARDAIRTQIQKAPSGQDAAVSCREYLAVSSQKK